MNKPDQNTPPDKHRMPPPDYYYDEEDEINLLDLVLVLFRHKWLIVGMVFITGVAAVVISLMMTNIYRSTATIVTREEKNTPSALSGLGGFGGMVASELGLSGGGSLEKLELLLKSRNLTFRVVEKYDLMPLIFYKIWDPEAKKWLDEVEEPPTLQDAYKAINDGLLSVSVQDEKGSIEVGFNHPDPETSKKIVSHYLTELSEMLREEVIKDATEKMRFFREQLKVTQDPLLREKIYNLLAQQIEKDTFARAEEYYGFTVLDPPVAPDLDKKVEPKRAIICILSVVVAFFMAVFLAFLLEFGKRVKTEDPERYNELAGELKFWRKSREKPEKSQRTDDRGQRTDDRKTEDRRQRTEDRGQKNRGQTTEDRGQKNRGQTTEDR